MYDYQVDPFETNNVINRVEYEEVRRNFIGMVNTYIQRKGRSSAVITGTFVCLFVFVCLFNVLKIKMRIEISFPTLKKAKCEKAMRTEPWLGIYLWITTIRLLRRLVALTRKQLRN